MEEGIASYSSILVWRIPWTEDLVGYSPWGCKESDMTEQLTYTHARRMVLSKETPRFTCSSDVCLFFKNTAVDTYQVLRNNLGAEEHKMPVGTRSAFWEG